MRGLPGLALEMIGVAVVTAVLVAASPARLKHIFWTKLSAYPAATAIRASIEVAKDPTDHNLWPFELVYAGVVSVVAVVPGLLVGKIVRTDSSVRSYKRNRAKMPLAFPLPSAKVPSETGGLRED